MTSRRRTASTPVILVSGFLGAGKTTLLQKLLAMPAFSQTALIINEAGDLAIDDQLIEVSGASPVVLAGGCICCALKSSLEYTLRDLFLKRSEGAIPHFERVVIETTGLAKPGAIIRSLVGDPWIAARFTLSGRIAVVDCTNFMEAVHRHSEPAAQVAQSDRVVLTKCDLVGPDRIEAVRQHVERLNPLAGIAAAEFGAVDPGFVIGVSEAPDMAALALEADSAGDSEHHGNITTASIRLSEPLDWPGVAGALDGLARRQGARLLRVKGILRIGDCPAPVVVHGVQGLFHPPTFLDRWPAGRRDSRLVFIAQDVPAAEIAGAFAAAMRQIHPIAAGRATA